MIFPAATGTSGGGGDSNGRFLLAQLQAIEGRVTSAPAQQLVVTTRFDDSPILDDEDAVGVHHGMQAVGDDDGRAPLAKVLDGALNLALGFRIERGGCLVEQDEGGVFEQGARDGDALALAAGELEPVLPDRRVIATG